MQQLGGRMTTYTENASHFEDGYPGSALLTVAGEVWMASRCDYFVVTKGSGLGTQAAFRSQHPLDEQRVRQVSFGRTQRNGGGNHTRSNCQHVELDRLAADHSGI